MGNEEVNKCEICNAGLEKVEYDSPVYCGTCIEEMEKRSMTPERYVKFRELKETLKK